MSTLRNSPRGPAGTSDLENDVHAESYFQPVNDHDTLNNDQLPTTGGSTFTAMASEQLAPSAEVENIPNITPHFHPHEEMVCRSSEAPGKPCDIDCINTDEENLGKDLKDDKKSHLLDEGLSAEHDILSSPPLSHSSSVSSKIPPDVISKENVSVSFSTQQSLKTITTLSHSSSPETTSEKQILFPDTSINQTHVQHEQPNPSDPSPDVPPAKPKTKLGGSANYMPVFYLQVSKVVPEEHQQPIKSLNAISLNEATGLASHVLSLKNDDLENQGHKSAAVVSDSTTGIQENSVRNTPTKTRDSGGPVLKTQEADWTLQTVSEATYNSYYGSLYHHNLNTNPRFLDERAVNDHYSQHAWMDLRGQWPQRRHEEQLYEQNNQVERGKLRQHEKFGSKHTCKSDQLSSRQRAKENHVRPEQDKSSSCWSESYTSYYNPRGWNPQAYYSPSYYSYYYPYYHGHHSEASNDPSQPYNTRLDNYYDWWRYDPRYDSSFDSDYLGRYDQSYWEQCDRQSNHSGYSSQSMPSTHSHHSWQSWEYQNLQHKAHSNGDSNVQSAPHYEEYDQLKDIPSDQDSSATYSSLKCPEQFSSPHCCARFSPGGQLIQVLPNLPSEGKPALVQIHSTEMMLQGCWDQEDLQTFPGPLIKDKTHKADVLEFVTMMSQKCLHNDTLKDKEASCLIWDLIELVCRQNGKLVGTDISHLLLRSQRSPSSPKKAMSDLIDFTNEPLSRMSENQECNAGSATEDPFWTTPKDSERDLEQFRELLIFGKKKDALESAISKGLWGHAFMLASKMDSRACSEVMSKFIDSIPESDVLRTFYQLMSGRIPLAASHCGLKDWGDWCTHLAMVLSNHTRFKQLHKKTISRMGDALASKECSDAASFCYMVVQLDVDTQSNKSDIFLFGAAPNFSPLKYATNEAIQRTELLEYGLSLGSESVYLPNFQIYKYIYACRLAEAGLYAQACQYCEVIAKALLASDVRGYLTLISQLIELSTRIRHFDPQLKDIPDLDLSSEPEWIVNLRTLHSQIIEELHSTSSKENNSDSIPTLNKDLQGISCKNTAIEKCDPSYNISLLNIEIPTNEDEPVELQLVPPAPESTLEITTRNTPENSSQAFGPDPVEPESKAVPLATSKDSEEPSHLAYPNLPPEVVLSQAVKLQTDFEPDLQNLPSSIELLPEELNTKDADCLSDDQSKQDSDSILTLALPLPAPPTLQQCPVITDSTTVQSQHSEDLQSKSPSTVPMPTQLTSRLALTSTLLPSSMPQAADSASVPQLATPLPFSQSIEQTGQYYQSPQPITQPIVAGSAPPLSFPSTHWVTGQNVYSCEMQPEPLKATSQFCAPMDSQALYPRGYNGMPQSIYNGGSQELPRLTVPSAVPDILPPNEYSAGQGQNVEQTQLMPPPRTSLLPLDKTLGRNPLLGVKQYPMAEKKAPPVQTVASFKPLMPNLFVPQSLPPEPQSKKEESGWFSWLFRKRKDQSQPDTNNLNLNQTQNSPTTGKEELCNPSQPSQSIF